MYPVPIFHLRRKDRNLHSDLSFSNHSQDGQLRLSRSARSTLSSKNIATHQFLVSRIWESEILGFGIFGREPGL